MKTYMICKDLGTNVAFSELINEETSPKKILFDLSPRREM